MRTRTNQQFVSLSRPILQEDFEEEVEKHSSEHNQLVSIIDPLNLIILNGDINEEKSNIVSQVLLAYDYKNRIENKFRPIHFIINSNGGSITDAWQICDIMDAISYPTITIGVGEIASAALLIFINGEPGFRILSPKTSLMSHQYSWGVAGKMENLISASKEFENINERMLKHFEEKTKLKPKKIQEVLLSGSDKWITPKEAVELNLADHIFDFRFQKPFFFIEKKEEWLKIKKEMKTKNNEGKLKND